MLNEKSPRFRLVEKSKCSEVISNTDSYTGYMLDPFIITKLNVFHDLTIRNVFSKDESQDLFSIIDEEIPIENFVSNSLSCQANIICLDHKSIFVFQNDRAVFYASLVSTVYYAILENNAILIVFRNGNEFVDISFNCPDNDRILLYIRHVLSLYITKKNWIDEKSDIQFFWKGFKTIISMNNGLCHMFK